MPRGTERQAVVGCTLHSTGDAQRAEDSLQDDTGWLVYGRGSVRGWRAGEAGKLAGRERRRGGLLPSRESEFLLSHSPIWLAVVKTIAWHLLSLCRWSPSYESALRAASGGESGGPVISCTANIRILYRDASFLMLGKRFRVASSLTFLVADMHIFYLHCLVARCDKLTNKCTSVSCFSRVDLQKTLR